MKKWIWITGGVVLLGVIVFASVRGAGPKGEKVYLEPVARRDIEAVVSAPGEIDPKLKVNISAHVIGKIERLYFEEGDLVKRGQRLVDLERVSYEAARDRMRAEVANRRIEVQRAKVNLASAEANLRRAEQLSREGIQADQLLEKSQLDVANARANLAGAEEGVLQAMAALKQAQDDLSRTTIVSPIDGKVVQLNAHEGEVVITGTMNNPGSVIATIADLSEVLVLAEVGETEIVEVEPGQQVRVIVDAIPNDEYQGKVVEIGSSATTRAGVGAGIRYFKVKVLLENPDDRLRPGMTTQVEIITSAAREVLAVPVQSVVERDPDQLGKKEDDEDDRESGEKKKYVFVAEEGKAKAIPVETGISDATHVAIVSGLKGGEQVVTGPFRTLKRLDEGTVLQPESEKKRSSEGDENEDEDDESEDEQE
ncbi:MAG TPA: efflux RND transporter periplasmic adaptor subunit [Thermoanaerobaculia bacterium]|nr:efflux RND transporter periplasmic adaptor subunit [Thermoanaerobaculia bacterium]